MLTVPLGAVDTRRIFVSQLSDEGRLIAFDQDETAIAHAKEKLIRIRK